MKGRGRRREAEPTRTTTRTFLFALIIFQVSLILFPKNGSVGSVDNVDFTFTGGDTVLHEVPFPVNLRINNSSLKKCAVVVVAVPKVLQMFGAVIRPNTYTENTIVVGPGDDVQLLYYMQQLAGSALELQVIVIEIKESGDQYQSPQHLTQWGGTGTVVYDGTEIIKTAECICGYYQS